MCSSKVKFPSCTKQCGGWSQFLLPVTTAVCGILYMYMILFILSIVVNLSYSMANGSNHIETTLPYHDFSFSGLSLLSMMHIKVAYLALIARPISRFVYLGLYRSMTQ